MKKMITLLLVLTGMVCTASAWTLRGSFDEWSTGVAFVDGVATLDLKQGQSIEFKVENTGSWYGNSGTMTWENHTGWVFDNISNCRLNAGYAGTYTFTLTEGNNPTISVTYPAKTVYLCNNQNWAQPYVYALGSSYWDSNQGSGSYDRNAGVAMTQVDGCIWKAEISSGVDIKYIAFLKDQQDSYEHFYNTEAIYKENFSTDAPLYVPGTTVSEEKNGTKYYNNGAYYTYPAYTRSVTADNFGTICLPFAATVTGATVFKITGKTEDGSGNLTAINLDPVEGALEAGMAYIFKATDATLTATYSGTYADASAGYGMMGNLSASAAPVPTGNYVVGTDNKLHKVTGDGVTVGQNKGYITLDGIGTASARSLNFISFDDETTGITSTAMQPSIGQYFDLQGRRVAQPTKGLYIVNGKKVVIR